MATVGHVVLCREELREDASVSVTCEPSFVHGGNITWFLQSTSCKQTNLELTAKYYQGIKYSLRRRPLRCFYKCHKIYVNCCETFWLAFEFEKTVSVATLNSCHLNLHFFDYKHPHLHWQPDIYLISAFSRERAVEIAVSVHLGKPCLCAMLLRVFFLEENSKERSAAVQLAVMQR
jgi:hypothetical protein